MNVPEAQAKNFARQYFNSSKPNTLNNLAERLNDKLYVFKREIDKLNFLKVLIPEIHFDIDKHEETCATNGCRYREDKAEGLFLIQQEIDFINESFVYEPRQEDTFSTEAETALHNKLNEIIENIKQQGLGQEILFEEIESLKNHFSLGKKTWFQLLKGKMVDVAIDKGVEIIVVQQVIDALADGYDYGIGLLR